MFGIGLPELAVILLVAVVVFGPDKLPDLAKQAAHLVRQVKSLADGARDELRTQLGPEYADLEFRDLDPRTLVRRHITSAMEDDWLSDKDAGPDSERPTDAVISADEADDAAESLESLESLDDYASVDTAQGLTFGSLDDPAPSSSTTDVPAPKIQLRKIHLTPAALAAQPSQK